MGQEETVVFLKEFITFYILQNYYMCRSRGNCSIFKELITFYTLQETVVFLKEWTLRFACYKIATCVELDETVEFFR